MEQVPRELLIHVTADSRYRLFVNGIALGRGPLKGTLQHYHAETYDLARHLKRGRNTLAAEVRWFGENAPQSEIHSALPGWLVRCPTRPELDTPGAWKVRDDRSVIPDTTRYHDNAQDFLNHTEFVDLRLRDRHDWTAPDYDDTSWNAAVPIGRGVNQDVKWGLADLRTLFPRPLPQLPEEARRFVRTIQRHAVVPHRFGDNPQPWSLEAGEGGSIILDAGGMTTAYPVFHFAGGAGREVRITYAEAMGFWVERNGQRRWEKRRRDDLAGEPHGYRDTLVLSGRGDRYEPFHWRTFWFVMIEVRPGPEPCALLDTHFRRCIFPQTLKARFDSSDADAAAMWETSWRTAELCAHETYEDCPYYEQLNYVADTRIEALISYYLANETRLAREAIRLYRESLRPDGLIGSRVPSISAQIIPHFCFHWIFMVEDYWRWVGPRDQAFVRACLPVVDHILAYFRARLRSDGFVGPVDGWGVIDAHQPGWTEGVAPAIKTGGSTFLTCMYIQALDTAVRLHEQAGHPEDADRWHGLPDRLRRAVQTAWSAARGVFLEAVDRPFDPAIVHTQCAAIAAGAADSAQQERIVQHYRDGHFYPPSFMQSYYLTRALEHAGHYGLFHSHVLERWRDMLRNGANTWWEYPNPTRSDCHGWSAWIAVDFITCALGIRPGAPGWTRIQIAPLTDELEHASGSIETPAGRIDVSWRRTSGSLEFHARTPEGVPVDVTLPDSRTRHFPRGGEISLSATLAACSP